MENEASLFKERLKRYGNVSLGIASLFPGVILESLEESGKEDRARKIRAVLGNLKGPLMKIAQILGTVPGIIPEEYEEELRGLQSQAPSMGWPFVKRRMIQELGISWQDIFESFEKTATFAASLGQVHRAVDKKGRSLALKLQYPNMQSIIEADLAQFKLLLWVYERISPGIKTQEIYQEIQEHLVQEINYEREAFFTEAFGEILREYPGIRIPKVVQEFTTKRLLALSWEEGEGLLSFIEKPLELRNALAKNIFQAWYVPFYQYALLHGDPHLGNYKGQENGVITVFDFGCVRVFNPKFLQGVIDLYQALLKNDEDLKVYAYESWGFTNLQKDFLDVLDLWAKFLYGPLLYDKALYLEEISAPSQGKSIAFKVHEELRKRGGICPPREFVFMDRVAVGLGSGFMRLRACLNWQRLFEEVIEGFDRGLVEERQKNILKKLA